MQKIYSTLSQKKESLKPRRGKTLNLFVCGPTVYDYSHIGHARTYVAFDALVKYLREKGFDVFYLQNITDIDDKIIQRAKEEKIAPAELARRFEKEYFEDMKALLVDSVTRYARATSHIEEIVSQVERLLKKGYAYQTEDGVYYDVLEFKDYGKLSGRTITRKDDSVTRIDESVQKRNQRDFALWKVSKEGEPKWESPWGEGRPGWHIEDTAITEKFFGPRYDIHGGARDLLFPHHEAEVAQMEALSGRKPLAKYWMHTGFLTVGGEKMAKSQGNFITIRGFLEKHSPRILRLLVLKAHYRSPIDYSDSIVLQAERELQRIDEFTDRLEAAKDQTGLKGGREGAKLLSEMEKRIAKALEDDFNTPEAFAELFEGIRQANVLMDESRFSAAEAKAFLDSLGKLDRILGFLFWGRMRPDVPEEIRNLAELREEHRKNKEWKKADAIRKQLQDKGWRVDDTSRGARLVKEEDV